MTQAMTFNDIPLTPIPYQNSLWIRAAELARALGFSREDKVAQIYQRHADEFTSDMTQLIENVVEPQNEVSQNLSAGRCRIFSLRGCHLLAMFARTPVAKQFRRWVLDVIEQYGDRVPVEPTALPDESPSFPGSVSVTPSTVKDRKPLRSLVNAWAQVSAQPFNVCWTQLKAAFRLSDIRDLPQEWIPDALAWVQTKIDGITIPRNSPEFPAVPSHHSIYADRVKALTDLEKRFMEFAGETRTRLSALNAEYHSLNQGAYAAMLGTIPAMDPASKDKLIDALASQSYDACNWIDEGLSRMRLAIVSARAANRTLAR